MPVDQIQYSEKYNDDKYEYSTDVHGTSRIHPKDDQGIFLCPQDISGMISGDFVLSGHVILPPNIARHVPKTHLMTETEWRNLGVQQSPGWVHYMMHGPEPHVLLFRRLRNNFETPRCISSTGEIPVCC